MPDILCAVIVVSVLSIPGRVQNKIIPILTVTLRALTPKNVCVLRAGRLETRAER